MGSLNSGASLQQGKGLLPALSAAASTCPNPTTTTNNNPHAPPWSSPAELLAQSREVVTPTGQVQLGVRVPLCSPVRARGAPYPASPAAGATAAAVAATPGGRGLHRPGAAVKPWRIVPRSDPPGRKAGVSGRWRVQLQDQPAARSIRFRFCFSPRGCKEVQSGDRSVTQHPHPCFGRSPGGPQWHPLLSEAALVPPSAGPPPVQAGDLPFRSLVLSSLQTQTPLGPLCSFVRTLNFSPVHLSPALAAGPR